MLSIRELISIDYICQPHPEFFCYIFSATLFSDIRCVFLCGVIHELLYM